MWNVPLEMTTHILEKADFSQKTNRIKTIAAMPRLHVASGSYVVTSPPPQILEAHLGTCVGVTLCDRHANVGGLIHLLLPEPTGMQKDWQPVLYATTGLPLFLQALSDAGASKDNLKAFVAGGALIGPLSEKDLIFNIGGRTTEIVEEILHREGIPISKSETGGYFSCRLTLNTETWESHIEPAGISNTPSEKAYCQKPTFEQIEDAVERVRPIPQIALKIISPTSCFFCDFRDKFCHFQMPTYVQDSLPPGN